MNDATPGPGHNQPPLLARILERKDELADAFPKLATLELDRSTIGKVADYARQIAVVLKEAGELEKVEKAPHADASKEIKKRWDDRLELLRSYEIDVRETLYDYMRENAEEQITGEYGATASLARKATFAISDPDKLDINQLREFFDQASIDKAIRAAQKKGTELKGVRYYYSTILTVK